MGLDIILILFDYHQLHGLCFDELTLFSLYLSHCDDLLLHFCFEKSRLANAFKQNEDKYYGLKFDTGMRH